MEGVLDIMGGAKGFALVAAILFVVSTADADTLAIYSDAAFTDSTLNDDAPRLVNLYLLHSDFVESSAVRFATHASPGFTGVWLGDSTPYLKIGTSPVDVSVIYGQCVRAPVHVLTMSYQLFGTSLPCASLTIGGPEDGPPVALAISIICFDPVQCYPRALHINCGPVATEPTTWGKVKALYRN